MKALEFIKHAAAKKERDWITPAGAAVGGLSAAAAADVGGPLINTALYNMLEKAERKGPKLAERVRPLYGLLNKTRPALYIAGIGGGSALGAYTAAKLKKLLGREKP